MVIVNGQYLIFEYDPALIYIFVIRLDILTYFFNLILNGANYFTGFQHNDIGFNGRSKCIIKVELFLLGRNKLQNINLSA